LSRPDTWARSEFKATTAGTATPMEKPVATSASPMAAITIGFPAAAAVPRPVFDVVLDASLEVRSAVVYATLIVALVFIPVLGMFAVPELLDALNRSLV